jgi:opacity protein-like surface antigen
MMMRKLTVMGSLIAALAHPAAALAADYPAPAAAVAPVAAVPLWTGFYFGGHAGFGESKKKFIDNFPTYDGELDADPNMKGGLGGLQAGYSHQFNWLVIGVEGDFSWAGMREKEFSCFFFGDQVCSAEAQWFSTVTGRVGAAVGPTLLYVKGGAAWARDEYTDLATCAGVQPIFRAGIYADCGSTYVGQHSRHGWTLGAGIEYRVSPNWSLKAEYAHMDFGKKSVWLRDEEGDAFTEEIHQHANVVKVGFNYFFTPVPVAPAAVAPVVSAYAQGGTAVSPTLSDGERRPGNVVVFTGTDVSQKMFASWAGGLIALSQDLDTTGPRVMLLGGGGRYKYRTSEVPVRGTFVFGDILAGYGFEGDNYSINLLAGLNAVNHMLSPFDPANTVQGTEAGFKVFGSAYVNPTPRTLIYAEADYSTAFETFSTKHKLGYDFFGAGQIFIGPEASYFRDERSDEWRVGAHVSGIKLGGLEFDLAGGYSDDEIRGEGGYGRVEANYRF